MLQDNKAAKIDLMMVEVMVVVDVCVSGPPIPLNRHPLIWENHILNIHIFIYLWASGTKYSSPVLVLSSSQRNCPTELPAYSRWAPWFFRFQVTWEVSLVWVSPAPVDTFVPFPQLPLQRLPASSLLPGFGLRGPPSLTALGASG